MNIGQEFCRQKNFQRLPRKYIGFYPIAPDVIWLKRLVGWGASMVQLRIKYENLQKISSDFKWINAKIEEEIAEASDFCRKRHVTLIVNDHFKFALKYGASGIHLGQEDLRLLSDEDIKFINESPLDVGISTHSEEELANALEWQPSYIALGPIFHTTCKSLAYGPHGLNQIKEWCKKSSLPVVAIGGMKVEHVKVALSLGAAGVAVISDILSDPFPHQKTREWISAFEQEC